MVGPLTHLETKKIKKRIKKRIKIKIKIKKRREEKPRQNRGRGIKSKAKLSARKKKRHGKRKKKRQFWEKVLLFGGLVKTEKKKGEMCKKLLNKGNWKCKQGVWSG